MKGRRDLPGNEKSGGIRASSIRVNRLECCLLPDPCIVSDPIARLISWTLFKFMSHAAILTGSD